MLDYFMSEIKKHLLNQLKAQMIFLVKTRHNLVGKKVSIQSMMLLTLGLELADWVMS